MTILFRTKPSFLGVFTSFFIFFSTSSALGDSVLFDPILGGHIIGGQKVACQASMERYAAASKASVQTHTFGTRDLLIFHDTYCEPVGAETPIILSDLLSAIDHNCAPLLVSAPLMKSLVEHARLVEKTAAAGTLKALSKKITTIMAPVAPGAANMKQYHQKVIQEIKTTYTTAFKGKEKIKDIISYLCLQAVEQLVHWCVYQPASKDYYLLVPAHLDHEAAAQGTAVGKITAKEQVLGLKVDHLLPVTDKTTLGDKCNQCNGTVASVLEACMVTHGDMLNQKQYMHSFNIFMTGHGTNKGNHAAVADISVAEFKKMLNFFEHKVPTRLLLYATCYGAGDQLRKIYEGNPVYTYMIVSLALTDMPSYGHYGQLESSFMAHKLRHYPVSGTWHYAYTSFPQNWQAFLAKLKTHIFDVDHSDKFLDILQDIVSFKYVQNIPNIRLPNQTECIIAHQRPHIAIINAPFVALQRTLGLGIVIPQSKQFLLLDAHNIDVPVTLQGKISPVFVPVLPGISTMYAKQLKAPDISVDSLCESAVGIKGQIFKKTLAVELLECGNTTGAHKNIFGAAKAIKLKNVVITVGESVCFTLSKNVAKPAVKKPAVKKPIKKPTVKKTVGKKSFQDVDSVDDDVDGVDTDDVSDTLDSGDTFDGMSTIFGFFESAAKAVAHQVVGKSGNAEVAYKFVPEKGITPLSKKEQLTYELDFNSAKKQAATA